MFDSNEGFILSLSRLRSISYESKIEDYLRIDFLSTAISWKEPCQSSAHSLLLAASNKIRMIESGTNIMMLVYYMTGISLARTRIMYSKAKLMRAIRLQSIV